MSKLPIVIHNIDDLTPATLLARIDPPSVTGDSREWTQYALWCLYKNNVNFGEQHGEVAYFIQMMGPTGGPIKDIPLIYHEKAKKILLSDRTYIERLVILIREYLKKNKKFHQVA